MERIDSTRRIADLVARERERLLREAGLSTRSVRHFRRPGERLFTREERDRVTLLFGGLTERHDRLFQAALEGLGLRTALVPQPTKVDFQAGKEFGNKGQCNPTYFTVGALVNYLKRLRDDEAIPTPRILSDYAFVTAGACGPCRFGMYEAEYRLALRNAGFDGFRVLLVAQEAGFAEAAVEAGLDADLDFYLRLANAMLMGDLLNAVANHIRPYEIESGTTDAVLEECLALCQECLRRKPRAPVGWVVRLLSRVVRGWSPPDVAAVLTQLRDTRYVEALARCRRLIEEEIEVDYTRLKPVVKVTGEFWAQTTEGEGNFNMFRFLEGEGAEVLIEPVTTWLDFTLNWWRQNVVDRRGLDEAAEPVAPWQWRERLRREAAHRKTMLLAKLAARVLAREYERLRQALGGTAHELANQLELERIGHPYYNSRCAGGEGHLEVAKNIYYLNRDLAHMVLSLKPFGCLPSTQSDGAQAAVLAHYPDMIFVPIETSGEGDINAYSRVQMALGEAKNRCKAEWKLALERTGYGLDDVRQYVARHPDLRRPLQILPHERGAVSRAARFAVHVARRMQEDSTCAAPSRFAATV
jgi:predicted nucleotide-binding protein (sugar kinase/HSP70/actin superfamily)